MEPQEQIAGLERRLRKLGRLLGLTFGLLLLTIGFLGTRWVLGIEGRLDLQGKRVYVHTGGGGLTTSTIRPYGLETHAFDDTSLPYGRHVLLTVSPERSQLSLTENSTTRNRDLALFIAGNRSGLSIRDDQQRERISLSLHEDGPTLLLMDENGQAIFQAP